ncbi:hypothetical protein [Novosphingobium sp. TCA1]|uniref:hypothetical protein n=1 Tax=Novosphingobium sp. TCA1 TaxID=2682474 RepID=UPI001308653F|nr:hypothetical protein [Novosphingobium sp. TCA1]GFE77318.1 hypothetical protein NTCA1_49670 [Novosphingobium sp. TCA1]
MSNQRWSLDFISDALVCGRRFGIFALVDSYCREGLRLVADTSISGLRLAREIHLAILERLVKLAIAVSDNVSELISMAILWWSRDGHVE